MNLINICPVCNSEKIIDFYQVKNIPVQSVVLLHTREDALNFPKGDLILAYCEVCSFVFNRAYQPELVNYRLENESTQRYSGTFNQFEKKLAQDLINKFSLNNKTILEIGCGQGEFLEILCENHGNSAIGFDPAYDPDLHQIKNNQIRIIPDFYTSKYKNLRADFVCCKMTLEHIHQPVPLLKTIFISIQNTQHPTEVFFQIPESGRIFSEFAFWDLYYEHCSYYSSSSLTTLFNRQLFEISELWTDYDNQYLMISARLPKKTTQTENLPAQSFLKIIKNFECYISEILNRWKKFFKMNIGKTIVVWGAGSKCVAFCTTLGLTNEITCTVDINPHKKDTYLPGSGHKVIHPEMLAEIHPQIVIVMNPIYESEIKNLCAQYSIFPEFVKITDLNDELPNL